MCHVNVRARLVNKYAADAVANKGSSDRRTLRTSRNGVVLRVRSLSHVRLLGTSFEPDMVKLTTFVRAMVEDGEALRHDG